MDNLALNAIKHSRHGTPVTAELVKEEAIVVFRVIDEGDGILLEDQPYLFTSFYRTNDARKNGIGGNGLGLAIVSRICDILGGSIEVKNEPGCGSIFQCRIPVIGCNNQYSCTGGLPYR